MGARAYAAALAYIGSVVGANWMAQRYGFIPVGFGHEAAAGTYAAGAALLFRDLVQDALGRYWALACIAIGAALTFTFSPMLAGASAGAFLVAELFDMGVYTPLRKRGWSRAVIASGTVGALVDTVVFLQLSGFGVTWTNMQGQLIGKILWATLIPVAVIASYRRVVRH